MHENKARIVLPLSSPRIPPRQPTRVVALATEGAIDVERVKISEAATPGGSADWVVNDIEINGRSQLVQKDLPGALFGARGVVAGARSSSTLLLHGLDLVENGGEFTLVITYVGPNPEGVPFFAAAVGAPPSTKTTNDPSDEQRTSA